MTIASQSKRFQIIMEQKEKCRIIGTEARSQGGYEVADHTTILEHEDQAIAWRKHLYSNHLGPMNHNIFLKNK